MATITQEDTMVNVAQPAVSTTRAGMPDISTQIKGAAGVLRESFSPKDKYADPNKVLALGNQMVDDFVETYKTSPDMKPIDFENKMRANLIDLFTASNLNPDDWSKVNSMLSGRVGALTQTYHHTENGSVTIVDNFGHAQFNRRKDMTDVEYLKEALESQYPKQYKAILVTANKKGLTGTALSTYMHGYIETGLKYSMLSAERQAVQDKASIGEVARVDVQTKAKDKLYSVTADIVRDAYQQTVKGGVDNAEQALGQFEQMVMSLWDLAGASELSVTAGVGNAYKQSILAEIQQYRPMFLEEAKDNKDKIKLSMLKDQNALRYEVMIGKMSDDEFFTTKSPNAKQAMIFSRMWNSSVSITGKHALQITEDYEADIKDSDRLAKNEDYSQMVNVIGSISEAVIKAGDGTVGDTPIAWRHMGKYFTYFDQLDELNDEGKLSGKELTDYNTLLKVRTTMLKNSATFRQFDKARYYEGYADEISTEER